MQSATAPPRHLSPGRSSGILRRPSALNPSRAHATVAPAISRPAPLPPKSSTHLASLERLLQKPATAGAPPLREAYGEEGLEGSPWGLLNALNLSGVLPLERKVESMSPRSMTNLQRLLAGDVRPSPRCSIGPRWRELHGANDWEGLLDPLDEDLRREVVRYGEFVQAAYHAFHSNPAKRPTEPGRIPIPDRSYRVTRELFATASIEMPRCLDGMAPWMRQRTSWVGYVAVCDDMREIQRMGRRDVVIALRGTATALEWAENFRASMVKLPKEAAEAEAESEEDDKEAAEPRVERGFWSLFTTGSKRTASLRDAVVAEIRRVMEVYKGEKLSITVTGHSLGAALAVLVANELAACAPPGEEVPPIAVFSFGSPHVGNREFADRVKARGVKVLRIVNARDVITRMPGFFAGDGKPPEGKAEEGVCRGEARQRWWRAAVEGKRPAQRDRWWDAVGRAMTTWSYSHVGTELKLDSRQSPFLRPDAGPGCCHDLEAYLHLVDGFLSSRCPYRQNAKRSIAKLVAHQRSNMKQHYTSSALAAIGMEAAAQDAARRHGPLQPDGGAAGLLSPRSS